MKPSISNPGHEWCSLRLYDCAPSAANRIEDRLERILSRWEGTPYASGQQTCGVAADCIGFAFPVIDELYGRPSPPPGRLPPDVAMHDRQSAFEAVRRLRRMYEPCARVDGRFLEPGDIIVTGPAGGGPGHVMVVGPRKNTIWHCSTGRGVCWTGIGYLRSHMQLHAVYRFTDRWRWDLR